MPKNGPTVRPFRPSLDGPDCTAFGNGFFFLTKKWLVYFLALSLAMEKNGDLQKIAASNGQTSFLSDNKFWRKYEHLELFGVFFKWPELQDVCFYWSMCEAQVPQRFHWGDIACLVIPVLLESRGSPVEILYQAAAGIGQTPNMIMMCH